MCPLTANDYFGCCPHRYARRHDITGIAALVAHGPTVALLVEFRRIGPPELATRRVRSRCDCHILLAVDLKRYGRRREGVLLELLRRQGAARAHYQKWRCGSQSTPSAVVLKSYLTAAALMFSPNRPSFMPKANGWCRALGPVAVSSAEPGLAADRRVTQTVNRSKGIHCTKTIVHG
jgi:hypothetical protein